MKFKLLFLILVLMTARLGQAEKLPVSFEAANLPSSGCLVVPVDFTSILRWHGIDDGSFGGVECRLDGKQVPVQFVPVETSSKGLLAFAFSSELVAESKKRNLVFSLEFKRAEGEATSLNRNPPLQESVHIVCPAYEVFMKGTVGGGFPEKIKFVRSGKEYTGLRWYDRLHHKELGGWNLYDDKEAKLQLVSDGPVCTAVRLSGRFLQSNGKAPASNPRAVYHWLFFKGAEPLIYVTADYKQDKAFTWRELHFLEFHSNGQFPNWVSASQEDSTQFTGTNNSIRDRKACGVSAGNDCLVLFGRSSGIYDGKSKVSSYVIGDAAFAWTEWGKTESKNSGWIRIGELDPRLKCGEQLTNQADSLTGGHTALTVQTAKPDGKNWLVPTALSGMLNGSLPLVSDVNAVKSLTPYESSGNYIALESNDLGLLFSRHQDDQSSGLGLLALVDRHQCKTLTTGEYTSLFSLDLRDLTSKEKESVSVTSLEGWKKIDIQVDRLTRSARFIFTGPKGIDPEESGKISVIVTCKAGKEKGMEFGLEFKSETKRYSLMNAIFPSVQVRSLGRSTNAFYPTGPGLELVRPIETGSSHSFLYPSGFGAPMPWMAVWDRSTETGLYFGFHDSNGTPKTVRLQSSAARNSLLMEYDHPVPDMTKPSNSWQLSGVAKIQILHGDWYDAACLYRDWVRSSAKWYPRLGPEGRLDTPEWMKKLCLWCITSGKVATMPERMKKFKEAFGVPGACHWYNWHQIPFDNDYPHFLPSHDGFKEAVLEIQKDGDFAVMPYINGRLWDTRDKGMEDWQFTKVAKSAVSKLEDGSPKVESYHSKEKNGEKVVLGAMCPYTKLWQDKQRELVLRLMNEEHVLAVYLDQISASRSTLCMDPAHGHPLGGGAWWMTGYWTMLDKIRTDMKREVDDYPLSPEEKRIATARPDHLKNRMLTSECNAETYSHVLDGLLTWHWQYQNAVPAFSTVYCGAVQMFGRSYNGKPAAWRMKAAESLAFGEQIGWFNDSVLTQPECFGFIREVVRFRFHRVEYFYKGEMARPVSWLDTMPKMTEDWKWSGKPTLITADAVRTGTWRILQTSGSRKGEVKSVLIAFANASDQAVNSRVDLNLSELGFKEGHFELFQVNSEGQATQLPVAALKETVTFPAQKVFGWELIRK